MRSELKSIGVGLKVQICMDVEFRELYQLYYSRGSFRAMTQRGAAPL
jgi:hypothetical protein